MDVLIQMLAPAAVLLVTALCVAVTVARHTALSGRARDANRLRLDDLARLASAKGAAHEALDSHAEALQQRVVQLVSALRRLQLVLISLGFAGFGAAAGLVCAALPLAPSLGVALPPVVAAACWIAGLGYLLVAGGLALTELTQSVRSLVREHDRIETLAGREAWRHDAARQAGRQADERPERRRAG